MPEIGENISDSTKEKISREFSKLDFNDQTVKNFTDNVRRGIERRIKKSTGSRMENEYVFESRVLKLLCEDRALSVEECAEKYRERYKQFVGNENINGVLRRCSISDTSDRKKFFAWVENVVEAFVKALNTRSSDDFENYRKAQKGYDHNDFKSKVFCLMLYVKHPELDAKGDFRELEKLGSTLSKFLRFDMQDFLRNVCRSQPQDKKKTAPETASARKIEELENALKQSEMELKDLQDEFEKRLEENHQEEMIEFFSRLNSNQYGCILDEMMSAYVGICKLRRAKAQPPIEISGLFRVIENLVNFVKANEINPIMKLGEIKSWKAGDFNANGCEYVSDTPYSSAKEEKRVKVISPGWYYKDKNIQISRPRLKECGEDD